MTYILLMKNMLLKKLFLCVVSLDQGLKLCFSFLNRAVYQPKHLSTVGLCKFRFNNMVDNVITNQML